MGRPKIPLLSRRKTVEVALEIIDNEGLEALTSRRIGEALNVNGASLYHYFSSIQEIVAGAAQVAFGKVSTPHGPQDRWQDWLIRNTFASRDALLAHPALIPFMLQRIPMSIGIKEIDLSVTRLADEGLATGVIVPMMEALELLSVVSALLQSDEDTTDPGTAAADGDFTSGQLFELLLPRVIAELPGLAARPSPSSVGLSRSG